jgi:membrane protease YdiL (CAAX protease family)
VSDPISRSGGGRAPNRLAVRATQAVALTFPTATAWAYFLALGGGGQPNLLQQAAYAAGKAVQLSIPLLFLAFIARERVAWRRPNGSGLVLGLGFGLLVGGAFLAAWFVGLRSSTTAAEAAVRIRAKMAEFGVVSPMKFLALSVFLCAAHSFLEEYYWRWFVFGRLLGLLPLWGAVLLSSLGFTAHHVLIVWAYLPGRVLTGVLPASLAVAIGGAAWAWLYHRAGSLLAPWLSHALVDAALFVIGWDLLRR